MPKWLKDLLDVLLGTKLPVPTTTTRPPMPTTTTTRPPVPPDGPPPIPPGGTTTTRPPTPPVTTTTPPPASSEVLQLLNAHNNYRSSRGLPPLRLNPKLLAAAQKHSDWMAAANILAHNGNGTTPFSRMNAEGYRYTRAAENIAMGYTNVQAVMAGWIGSPGHEANIRGGYIDVGFGVAANAVGQLYWTADFGYPSQASIGGTEVNAVQCSDPLYSGHTH